MTAIGPLIRPQLQHSPEEYAAIVEAAQPQLLELRTESGPVYLRPRGWERLRLQWAFRHFHVLCPELLSSGNRRLIEKLSRSAVVTPARPVPRNAVFGVVERAIPITAKTPGRIRAVESWPGSIGAVRAAPVRPASPMWQWAQEWLAVLRGLAVWAGRRHGMERWKGLAALGILCLAVILARIYGVPFHLGLGPAQESRPQTTPAQPGLASNAVHPKSISPKTTRDSTVAARLAALSEAISKGRELAAATLSVRHDLGSIDRSALEAQAGSLGALARKISLEPETPAPAPAAAQDQNAAPTLAPLSPLAFDSGSAQGYPRVPPGELAPGMEAGRPATTAAEPLESTATAPSTGALSGPPVGATSAASQPAASASPERPLITEFPQNHFAYPVLSNPNFVGKVSLRAVIGTDGSVKDVTVLSGDPKAAEAAAAAVKQWRYAPDEVNGHATEAETVIGINFFGRDAVSVTFAR